MTTNPHSAGHVSAAATAVALTFAALWLPGCTADDTAATAVAPAGPATLSVVDPTDGACVVLRADAGWTARVSIAATNWYMRPEGFCGTYPQCGYVVAFVDDQRVAQAAALVIDVPLGGLQTPSGEHRIRVELHDDADVVARGGDGKPLAVELTVEALAPGGSCTGPVADAGEDAPADAAEEAAPDAPEEATIAEAGEDVVQEAGDAGEDAAPQDAAPEADAAAADAAVEAGAEDAMEGGEAGDAEPPDGSSSD